MAGDSSDIDFSWVNDLEAKFRREKDAYDRTLEQYRDRVSGDISSSETRGRDRTSGDISFSEIRGQSTPGRQRAADSRFTSPPPSQNQPQRYFGVYQSSVEVKNGPHGSHGPQAPAQYEIVRTSESSVIQGSPAGRVTVAVKQQQPRPESPRFHQQRPESPRFHQQRPESPRFHQQRPESPRFHRPTPPLSPQPDVQDAVPFSNNVRLKAALFEQEAERVRDEMRLRDEQILRQKRMSQAYPPDQNGPVSPIPRLKANGAPLSPRNVDPYNPPYPPQRESMENPTSPSFRQRSPAFRQRSPSPINTPYIPRPDYDDDEGGEMQTSKNKKYMTNGGEVPYRNQNFQENNENGGQQLSPNSSAWASTVWSSERGSTANLNQRYHGNDRYEIANGRLQLSPTPGRALSPTHPAYLQATRQYNSTEYYRQNCQPQREVGKQSDKRRNISGSSWKPGPGAGASAGAGGGAGVKSSNKSQLDDSTSIGTGNSLGSVPPDRYSNRTENSYRGQPMTNGGGGGGGGYHVHAAAR